LEDCWVPGSRPIFSDRAPEGLREFREQDLKLATCSGRSPTRPGIEGLRNEYPAEISAVGRTPIRPDWPVIRLAGIHPILRAKFD
jgi:hypothetical protein